LFVILSSPADAAGAVGGGDCFVDATAALAAIAAVVIVVVDATVASLELQQLLDDVAV